MYTHTHIYTHMYMCIYVYVCIYIYIYTQYDNSDVKPANQEASAADGVRGWPPEPRPREEEQ